MPLRGPSLSSITSETGLTTDPASMLAMLMVGVSVRSPLLTVSLKAQLTAMLCRICSELTLSSPSTTEIADVNCFSVALLGCNKCVVFQLNVLINNFL